MSLKVIPLYKTLHSETGYDFSQTEKTCKSVKWIGRIQKITQIGEKPKIFTTFFAQFVIDLVICKGMKSSPLLGPFGDSEFWEFSLLKI